MTTPQALKAIFRVTGYKQKEIAERAGLPSQANVAMYLHSKSMKVDNLLLLLSACGYELVARSKSGEYPEVVIDEGITGGVRDRSARLLNEAKESRAEEEKANGAVGISEERMRAIIAEELEKMMKARAAAE